MIQTSVRHIERDVKGVAIRAFFVVRYGKDVFWQNTDGTFVSMHESEVPLWDLKDNVDGVLVSLVTQALLDDHVAGMSAKICRHDLLSSCGKGFVAIRKALHITQDDLAGVTGYAIGTISRYERGIYGMKLETARDLTEGLNILIGRRGCSFIFSLDDLFPID